MKLLTLVTHVCFYISEESCANEPGTYLGAANFCYLI